MFHLVLVERGTQSILREEKQSSEKNNVGTVCSADAADKQKVPPPTLGTVTRRKPPAGAAEGAVSGQSESPKSRQKPESDTQLM